MTVTSRQQISREISTAERAAAQAIYGLIMREYFVDVTVCTGREEVFVVLLVVSAPNCFKFSNQIKYYIIVRPKVDQSAGQLCLPHIAGP